MIRVAGDKKKDEKAQAEVLPPVEEEAPSAGLMEQMEAVSDPAMLPAEMAGSMPMGQVDQMVAGYRGPEQGPFQCSNCHFYDDNGSCAIVAGQIDPAGICNNFTPMQMQQQPELPVEEAPEPVPQE